MGMAAVPAVGAELSPAQIVAQRFPASWGAVQSGLQTSNNATVVSTRGVAPAESTRGIGPVASARAASPALPVGIEAYFNPSPANATPAPPALAYTDPAAASAQQGTYQLASATSAPEKRESKRAAALSNNVFNDTQIASIRERLNLTPAQQRVWPQVEAALRGLVYKKPAAGEKKSAALARTLDPASPEVARLKTAALPLVLSFNGEQKQELRALANLIGLGNMVAQF
jgi:hypothetical protein